MYAEAASGHKTKERTVTVRTSINQIQIPDLRQEQRSQSKAFIIGSLAFPGTLGI